MSLQLSNYAIVLASEYEKWGTEVGTLRDTAVCPMSHPAVVASMRDPPAAGGSEDPGR